MESTVAIPQNSGGCYVDKIVMTAKNEVKRKIPRGLPRGNRQRSLMKDRKRQIITAALLVAAFGFLALITEMPVGTALAEQGVYCDSGKTLYCWTCLPAWECRTQVGGSHCSDPVNP